MFHGVLDEARNLASGRFITSEATTVNASFFEALAADGDLGRTRGIDGTLKKFNLDALLLPTDGMFPLHYNLPIIVNMGFYFRLHLDTSGHRRISCRHR